MTSAAECCARRAHLRAMGWRGVEIARELASMWRLRRKNAAKTNGLAVSLQCVFDFIEPGDVLWVGDLLTVCQSQGYA